MIRKATREQLPQLVSLALALWPDNDPSEYASELEEMIARKDAAFFLAWEDTRAVGFAQCQLRRDYVEGTESSPVGYLEGIFVDEEYRCKGIARELLAVCEEWAKAMGCNEFASDCELDNTQSLRFHMAVGFTEANRVICFTKKL